MRTLEVFSGVFFFRGQQRERKEQEQGKSKKNISPSFSCDPTIRSDCPYSQRKASEKITSTVWLGEAAAAREEELVESKEAAAPPLLEELVESEDEELAPAAAAAAAAGF